MGRISWVFRLALVIGAGALLTTAVVAAVAPRLWRIANAHEEVPTDLPDFEPLAQRTYVYDTEGNEIAVYELENSQPVTLDQVPPEVIEAFLAVEDNQFWVHKGVNMRSLFRATLSNFASDAPQQGASTITMQVVKNDFLAGLERDGRYKLLQMVYAMRLEKQKTKQEILQRYLNTVFFGNNAYGIAAAAEIYFGKQVAELTFVEAAFLAGLVRSPSGYDPINNLERSRARFAEVLDRLVDDELLTEFQATEIADDFVIPERVKSIPTRATKRTYYTEALREYLLNESNLLGETYEERYNTLFRGGLRIHTTLNPYLQLKAEEARNVLPDTVQGIDAAIVSLDTKTAAIRAMVGGRGFEPGRNEVNMALAPSQTGSSIKIFILAAALQAGAEPDDMIDGTRGCRLPSDNPETPVFEITGGVAGGIFTLREQTYRSINCAFARLSQIVGLYRVVDMTYRMASSTYLYKGQPAQEREPIQPHASFATGANEMSTLDMAAGMQTIANLGVHQTPYYVDYIDDAAGNRIYTHSSKGERVLDTRVALTEISILKDVLTVGTAATSWPTSPRCVRPPARPAPSRATGPRCSSGRRRSCRRQCWCATRRATPRWTTSPSSSPKASTTCRAPRTRRASGVRTWSRRMSSSRSPIGPRHHRRPARPRACTCPVSSVCSGRCRPRRRCRPTRHRTRPTVPTRPAEMSRSRRHRRPCHPYRRPTPRCPAIRRPRPCRRSRCTRRSTAAPRSRPTCSTREHRFRRHHGPSMLHRANDR